MAEIANNTEINEYFNGNMTFCRTIIEEKQQKVKELQKKLIEESSNMTKIERKKIQLDMKQCEKHITHYKKLLYSIYNTRWR